MNKLTFLLLIVVFFNQKAISKESNYIDYFNKIYAKQIYIKNYDDFKQQLIENGFADKKWIQYTLYQNGIRKNEIDALREPKMIYLPVPKKLKTPEVKKSLNDKNKPICTLLSPDELSKNINYKSLYPNYKDYIFSRKLSSPKTGTTEEVLQEDKFYYEDLGRWVAFTDTINKDSGRPLEGYFLPPCYEEIIIKKVIAPVVKKDPEIKKELPAPRTETFLGQLSIGNVVIKSNDDLNSKFDLSFLKMGLLIQKPIDNYIFRTGIAINNYIKIKFTSDISSSSSNNIKYYFDYLLGVSRNKDKHYLTLQYDNLNYLLNINKPAQIILRPVRVDRLSFIDAYSLNKNYALLGGIAYLPSLFSKADGYEVSLGLKKTYSKELSFSGLYFRNDISKTGINNTSNGVVINSIYQF
jgi:hypothetical protein